MEDMTRATSTEKLRTIADGMRPLVTTLFDAMEEVAVMLRRGGNDQSVSVLVRARDVQAMLQAYGRLSAEVNRRALADTSRPAARVTPQRRRPSPRA